MAKIAIVDDEKVLVNSLAIVFEDEGYEVETFYDGISFLAVAEEIQPDIILLDLRLPDTTGIDVLGRIAEKKPDIQNNHDNSPRRHRHGDKGYEVRCL